MGASQLSTASKSRGPTRKKVPWGTGPYLAGHPELLGGAGAVGPWEKAKMVPEVHLGQLRPEVCFIVKDKKDHKTLILGRMRPFC